MLRRGCGGIGNTKTGAGGRAGGDAGAFAFPLAFVTAAAALGAAFGFGLGFAGDDTLLGLLGDAPVTLPPEAAVVIVAHLGHRTSYLLVLTLQPAARTQGRWYTRRHELLWQPTEAPATPQCAQRSRRERRQAASTLRRAPRSP